MASQKQIVGEKIGVAIPAYRDARRLARCLESIETCDPLWLSRVVVSDDSGDGSVAEVLRGRFPAVTWIVQERNVGFACAANDAVMRNPCEIVLLLNDDCEVVRDPRDVLSRLFADPAIFAVGLKSVDTDGRVREGAKRVVWRFGIAKVLHNERDQKPVSNGVQQTAYAVGGHAAYRRSLFVELGGFDRSFHPYYWEDVDLCQRAMNKGYRVVFAQDTQIRHGNDGAIRTTQQRVKIRQATWRNRLRFSDRHAKGVHRRFLPISKVWLSIQARLRGDAAMIEALHEAATMDEE